ncbi:restriction endonuclease [Agromyces indicus]|uniref:Restriction endonuclease n=1 Tax=Agromyces indicus TaxID=758919 RepID=A0ABU1FJC0_9MICO|nr:restriction endonuclease [Agromyces indicus]MDR5691861.1 restriction endonuclease [Agromyces indicus]
MENDDRLRSTLPTAGQLLRHVADALRAGGGSATNSEISKYVVDTLGLTEEQQEITRADGRISQVEQSISEAKSYLKRAGFADRSRQGVWALTEAGERASDDDLEDSARVAWRRWSEERKARAEAGESVADDATVPDLDDETGPLGIDWKQQVISALLTMSPSAFEDLAKRLLREAGFVNVKVRGRSGDGGIDGEGVYRPLPLIGFQVYWQSKRYSGTVSAEDVRNFRGAMVGRGDKGLFITTGTFTGPARDEAAREGAPPIDLIDGPALAELLAQYELGVRRKPVTSYEHSVDADFFQSFS